MTKDYSKRHNDARQARRARACETIGTLLGAISFVLIALDRIIRPNSIAIHSAIFLISFAGLAALAIGYACGRSNSE